MVSGMELQTVLSRLDEVYPTSKKLRAFRNTIPAITAFVCAVGFALSIVGYVSTLPTPPSNDTGPATTTTLVPTRGRPCDLQTELLYPGVDCSYRSVGQNEGFLVLYTVYYAVIASAAGYSGADAYVTQGFTTIFLFLTTICIVLNGEHFFIPVVIPTFIVILLLLVLVNLKKGSGNWMYLSSRLRGLTHSYHFDHEDLQQTKMMMEDFTGITIV